MSALYVRSGWIWVLLWALFFSWSAACTGQGQLEGQGQQDGQHQHDGGSSHDQGQQVDGQHQADSPSIPEARGNEGLQVDRQQTQDRGANIDAGAEQNVDTVVTPDQQVTPEQSNHESTSQGEQNGIEKGPSDTSSTPDADIVVTNASPYPPNGSELEPTLLNIATFWRFMPGSVYRPIVVQGTITIHNRSKAAITDLKVDAQLYLPRQTTSKYIEITPSNGPLPTSIPAGYSQNIAFDGAESNHGLPKYQKPADICGELYVPVIRFRYKVAGQDTSFRMYWRRVPFGCNCFGTHQCP